MVVTIAVCSFSVIGPLRVTLYFVLYICVCMCVFMFIFMDLWIYFFSFNVYSHLDNNSCHFYLFVELINLFYYFAACFRTLQSNMHSMVEYDACFSVLFKNFHQFQFISQVVISSVLILIIDELFGLQPLFEIRLIHPERKKWSLFKTH